jgi:hypothetical protein
MTDDELAALAQVATPGPCPICGGPALAIGMFYECADAGCGMNGTPLPAWNHLSSLAERLRAAEARATAEKDVRAYAQEAYDAATQAWEALEHYGQMRAALAAYVKAQSRMLEKWADGDENVKRDLWRDLHACENAGRAVLEVVLDSGEAARAALEARDAPGEGER